MYAGYIASMAQVPYTLVVNTSYTAAPYCNTVSPPTSLVNSYFGNSIPYVTMLNPNDANDVNPVYGPTSYTVLGMESMMQDINKNGASGMYIQWKGPISDSYPNNAQTCNGIQTDRKCEFASTKGLLNGACQYQTNEINHAIVVIGYGVDTVGCPSLGLPGPINYWIIQNSHGAVLVSLLICPDS